MGKALDALKKVSSEDTRVHGVCMGPVHPRYSGPALWEFEADMDRQTSGSE